MVICTTCGQDNPAHLVFCQMCGQRLGPRVVPPTPPIGITPPTLNPRPVSPAAGTVAMPTRPPAPELKLGGAAPPPLPVQAAPAPAAPPAAPAPAQAPPPAHKANLAKTLVDPMPPSMDGAPKRVCPICATANDMSMRYCESCGSTLQPQVPKAAPSAPAMPAAPPTAAVAVAAVPGLIQPARVVEVGAISAPMETVRVCGRCKGSSASSAQFCRFCGSSLADALPIPSGAIPTPPRAIEAPARTPPPPVPIAPPAAPAAPAVARSSDVLAAAAAVAPVVARGRLVVVAKDGGEGPSYPLYDQVDIGRSEGNIVIAEDRYLSPRHARLTRRAGQLYLRDLGSVNGVYLRLTPAKPAQPNGGKPAESEVPLQDQDLFLVGQQVIRFEIVRDAEEGLGPAVEHGTLLFGTPTAPRYARLCQRTIEGVTRDIYYLAKRETVLGRESGDIVFTEDPFLSRRHAAIRAATGLPAPAGTPEEFALVDLGSSNGTFIHIRAEVSLKDGDQFRIGQQLFRVDLTQDAAPGPVGQGIPQAGPADPTPQAGSRGS